MKDPIVKLKTLHAALVSDKDSDQGAVSDLEKQIAEAEENAGISEGKTESQEGKTRKKR